jgi:hypothetical protein
MRGSRAAGNATESREKGSRSDAVELRIIHLGDKCDSRLVVWGDINEKMSSNMI